MSSSASTFQADCTSKLSRNACFQLLKVLSSDEFCVSYLQVDSPDFGEFFRWVHGQWFEPASKPLELAGDKADKHLEGFRFTSIFGAVEQKLLRELGTEQMHQTFWTTKSVQVLGNADSRVVEIFHRVFGELSTPHSSFMQEPIHYWRPDSVAE